MNQKGMSMALTIVISLVVLVVVSLAVITITTGNVAKTGQSTQQAQDSGFCTIKLKNDCAARNIQQGVAHAVDCNGDSDTTDAGETGVC